ncbi:hypothetical protein [Rhodococcus sp. NPDC127528]|uniref:hypothetical protein n=1 Tax=unclassified Rhodococcus (in: high G+C Gram-positive bacteria) TaxID=192944 RepID=UPI00363BD37D
MSAGLFPDCVLPGCGHPVECIGEACGACQTAFGDQLRVGGIRLTEKQIEDRDRGTRAAYAARGFA